MSMACRLRLLDSSIRSRSVPRPLGPSHSCQGPSWRAASPTPRDDDDLAEVARHFRVQSTSHGHAQGQRLEHVQHQRQAGDVVQPGRRSLRPSSHVVAPRAADSSRTRLSALSDVPPMMPTTSMPGSQTEIGPWRNSSGWKEAAGTWLVSVSFRTASLARPWAAPPPSTTTREGFDAASSKALSMKGPAQASGPAAHQGRPRRRPHQAVPRAA